MNLEDVEVTESGIQVLGAVVKLQFLMPTSHLECLVLNAEFIPNFSFLSMLGGGGAGSSA